MTLLYWNFFHEWSYSSSVVRGCYIGPINILVLVASLTLYLKYEYEYADFDVACTKRDF